MSGVVVVSAAAVVAVLVCAMGWLYRLVHNTPWDALSVAVIISTAVTQLIVADMTVWFVKLGTGTTPLAVVSAIGRFGRSVVFVFNTYTGWNIAAILVLSALLGWCVGLGHAVRNRPRILPPTPPLAEPPVPEEEEEERPRMRLVATGVGSRIFPVMGSSHQMAGRNQCCVCDQEKEQTVHCTNIAAHVCMPCVIRWAITQPMSGNNWPCCRD